MVWIRTHFLFTSIYITLLFSVLEAKPEDFAADGSIDAKRIFDAAQSGKESLATFPTSANESATDVEIFGDWLKLIEGVPVFFFTADMDVDCDGTVSATWKPESYY